jgi:DNA-binding CsgD family transcriptional regulator
MPGLRNDVDRLLGLLPEFYAAQNLRTLPRHLVEFVPRLIPVDTSAFNLVNLSRRGVTVLIDPPPESFGVSGFSLTVQETMDEHPIIPYYARTGDGRALRLSDFTSHARFGRSRLYNEIFSPMGIEHLLTVSGPIAGNRDEHIALSLSRERSDFSERERRLLGMLRPHLLQIYSNAQALSRAQANLDELRRDVEQSANSSTIFVREGTMIHVSARARSWLLKYLGPLPGRDGLPETIARWARHWQDSISGKRTMTGRCAPLIVERGSNSRLIVRLLPRSAAGSFHLLLLEELRRDDPAVLVQLLGLSRREAEILAWIAHGKTSAEIASILSISRRTVDKHLEHIYPKLGVETRIAAAATTWNILRTAR